MTIDWNGFTPWSALAGGVLIGVATALYLLGNGRVAGIARFAYFIHQRARTLDVNLPFGQFGCQTDVLAFFADGQ